MLPIVNSLGKIHLIYWITLVCVYMCVCVCVCVCVCMYVYVYICIYIYIKKSYCRSKERKKYDFKIRILKWVGPRKDLYFFLKIYSFILFLHTCMFPACCFCHKALLMEYSMRLELTCICSLNNFQLVMGLYGGRSSLFLRVCLP